MIESDFCRRGPEPSSGVVRRPCRARSRWRGLAVAAPGTIVTHHLHQHAFPQSAIGNAQPRARKRAADRLEDRAAGENKVRPFCTDAWARDAFLVAHRQQPFDNRIDFLRAHPTTIHAVAIVALEVEMHTGNGCYRARSAEHVNAASPITTMLAHEWRDKRGHFPNHGIVTFTRHGYAAIALRQRHHAMRHGNPATNLRQRRSSAAALRARKP